MYYIIGAGGHSKVVAEIIELNKYAIAYFVDEDVTLNRVLSYQVIHEFPVGSEIAVLAIGDNRTRKRIALSKKYKYPILVHPKTCVSTHTKIGKGTVIVGGATVNIDTKIGKHVIVNTNASIGHDCVIGDYVHIAPNAALAGNVIVDEGTHIGIGVCVIQGVKIGKWCTIGAGTVVIRDIPDNTIVVGNPARLVRRQEKDTMSMQLIES